LPTAVKTGTSSDYHDSWTVGFDNRYTVGVWMGRLDGSATDGLTGSMGAAPVLRQIFARLRHAAPYAGLWHSPALRAVDTCEWIGPPPCVRRRDWYLPSTPEAKAATSTPRPMPSIARPVPGETLAIDPRVPRRAQQLRFTLDDAGRAIARVRWRVDGKGVTNTDGHTAQWTLQPGAHRVSARIWLEGKVMPVDRGPVRFRVLGPSAP
jgi:penicillin-binding protein 1C